MRFDTHACELAIAPLGAAQPFDPELVDPVERLTPVEPPATVDPRSVLDVVSELRAIENRFAPPGGTTVEAYRAQLHERRQRQADEPLELVLPESFARVLFSKLCERYGIHHHHDADDRRKLHLVAPHDFVVEVLWPRYDAMGAVIARFLDAHAEAVMTAWLDRSRAR